MAEYHRLHPWSVSTTEAQEIQRSLRAEVRVEPLAVDALRTVGGADVSADRSASTTYGGVVVLSLPGLDLLERAGARAEPAFPYVPGLLSFREAPAVLKAWEQLSRPPDALVCDGHGLAHPRRFGLACHLGLLLDVPTVGCAKSVLVGTHAPVGSERGDWTPLVYRGERVGAALRPQRGVAPVYVSVGHRCDLEGAIALVLRCLLTARVPETTRRAHDYVNDLRRSGTR